ncbi:MAG: FtsX-like permease family protein [Lachnospiraceae bacterium]|nr:FtsX-like permease family protein [Lachnospiraceae bacterium]
MLRITLLKLWHKKWMMLCLLLGSVLLIATVISFPLYKKAAFDSMLKEECRNYLKEEGDWPMVNSLSLTARADRNDVSFADVEAFVDGLNSRLNVTGQKTVSYYVVWPTPVTSTMLREDFKNPSLRLAFLTDMEEHCRMLGGEMYSEDGRAEDGSIEILINENLMLSANLLIGEKLKFGDLTDADGSPLYATVTGIYEKDANEDFYWQLSVTELDDVCLMQEEVFRELFLSEETVTHTVSASYYQFFEYDDLAASQVKELLNITDELLHESEYAKAMSVPDYIKVLESFLEKKFRIEATLFIMQVPVLILLCTFLFMISAQMYEMERNEISVIKSRGSFGGQIFRLYLYQSIFITFCGSVLGVPLGILFCRLLGSTRNFLEFNLHRELNITFDIETLLFMAAAIGISVLVMALPAWKHSKLSIVNLKQQKAARKFSWWERYCLDIMCLSISLYGYCTFASDRSGLAERVLGQESLDPLLYVSSSLFIVGLGLLALRLQPLLVKLLFRITEKRLKPAGYAFFLENIKNGRKQQFIMLFMILTISLGMYHAAVARTILQNSIENADYIYGADLILKEVWRDNSAYLAMNPELEFAYFEPDFGKYGGLSAAQSYTKVLYDTKAYIWTGGNERMPITLMGIHTREFGENTWVESSLLEKPYYEYLNELAVAEGGVLVSRNFQNVAGYRIGDEIIYYDKDGNRMSGRIVDFVDYWPGYAPYVTTLDFDGSARTQDNYLVITHINALMQAWGVVPYEVWITLKEDGGMTDFYQWMEENNVLFSKYIDKVENIEKTVEDPLLQGTNGVLTMGFIVTLLLCAVGYMIYWIMSIKAREMLFGVLRACGMHRGELFEILMYEQLFSGGFAIFVGLGIGVITSRIFVPILQTAYAAANQALPLRLITNIADTLRLYGVIGGMMLICLAVLILLVYKLNITKALKLGEE